MIQKYKISFLQKNAVMMVLNRQFYVLHDSGKTLEFKEP